MQHSSNSGKVQGVRVAVRVRPPVKHEVGSRTDLLQADGESKVVSIGKLNERAKQFRFDAVFGPEVSQVCPFSLLLAHRSMLACTHSHTHSAVHTHANVCLL